jgi:sRNA-binding protein
VFKRQPWEPHQPLACGIDRQLIDTGALSGDEAGAVMHRYVRRRMYQVALAAGGPRYNLDGTVGGEVTRDQAQGAHTMITKIEARRTKAAKAAKAEWLAVKATAKPNGISTSDDKAHPGKIALRPPQPIGAAAIATSLAGLRDAWRQRQADGAERRDDEDEAGPGYFR